MSVQLAHLSFEDCRTYQTDLIELLCDSVDGGASVGFLSPMDRTAAESFWQSVKESVKNGSTTLLAALDDGRLVGSVQLISSWKPNSPHRADVAKLLVHSDYRRRGIASLLMQQLETVALEYGFWLLVLDTELNSGAETLYKKIGFTRLGEIPEYVLSNDGKGYVATVYFYKKLR